MFAVAVDSCHNLKMFEFRILKPIYQYSSFQKRGDKHLLVYLKQWQLKRSNSLGEGAVGNHNDY